jgi:O-antigen ligase
MNALKTISLQFPNWSRGSRYSLVGVTIIALGVFGILYLGFPVTFLPLGLVALLLALITIRSPTIGLGFVIAAQYVPLQMAGFSLIPIIGAFVGVFCLIWVAVHKRGVVLPNIIFPILVMVLLSLYSLTYTKDVDLTQHMWQKLVINAVFCLLLVNVIDEYQKLRWPLWVLMLMGVVNSAAGVLQFSGRSDPNFRAEGLAGNQNGLGIVAATACVISFYHFLYEKDRRRRWGYLALCALLSAGIVASISRGATVAFVVALLYILLREVRHRKQVLIFVVLILAGFPLLPESFSRRFENIGQDVKGSIFFGERRELVGRGYYNKAGINIWKAHPLLGVGLGNYGYYFIQPEFNPGMKASRRLPAHNMYIQALAETGLVGFLVLCWWILQCAYNYWVAERKTEDDSHRLLLGSCEAVTLYTLVVYSSSGNVVHAPLAIVLALSAVCRRCGERAVADQTAAAGE